MEKQVKMCEILSFLLMNHLNPIGKLSFRKTSRNVFKITENLLLVQFSKNIILSRFWESPVFCTS